jgi:hypothetical protein
MREEGAAIDEDRLFGNALSSGGVWRASIGRSNRHMLVADLPRGCQPRLFLKALHVFFWKVA